MSDVRIVDEIPSLHAAYADLGPDGYWVYWEKMEDGRWMWNPKWVTLNMEYWQSRLNELKKDMEGLEKCEKDTPEEERTTEWFHIISARRRDLVEDIRYTESKLATG